MRRARGPGLACTGDKNSEFWIAVDTVMTSRALGAWTLRNGRRCAVSAAASRGEGTESSAPAACARAPYSAVDADCDLERDVSAQRRDDLMAITGVLVSSAGGRAGGTHTKYDGEGLAGAAARAGAFSASSKSDRARAELTWKQNPPVSCPIPCAFPVGW